VVIGNPGAGRELWAISFEPAKENSPFWQNEK